MKFNYEKMHCGGSIKNFIDSVGDGVMLVGKDGLIKMTNKATCKLLGYSSKKDVIGEVCLAVLSPTDNKGIIINNKNAVFYKSIKYNKSIGNVERQFIKIDGSRIWTSITTSPFIEDNVINGAIIIIRDITEQKMHEEYHKDFASNASHSLRSPIGNILWTMEYLLSKKPGSLNKKQKEYITDSYESLKHMNRLVNELLNISRLQTDKIIPKFKKVSLKSIVDNVTKDLDYFIKAQRVTVKSKIPANNNFYVKADAEHLNTIIQNVIENAVKYSDIKTEVDIAIKTSKDNIIFSCTNRGMAIPKNKEKFIFAKFFRADNAVEKTNEGTGLGLYTTNELTKLNKGKIWFDNIPGKEITFYVKLKKYGK
ncbi:MAG: ATP-binding protein [bacterium]|nr:ATP-binding protein [bacterium]